MGRVRVGGLVGRVPLPMVPESGFDELWLAACSPSGLRELRQGLADHRRRERLVVITPSQPLPVTRWTMEWRLIEQAIAAGKRDMTLAIERTLAEPGNVLLDPELITRRIL